MDLSSIFCSLVEKRLLSILPRAKVSNFCKLRLGNFSHQLLSEQQLYIYSQHCSGPVMLSIFKLSTYRNFLNKLSTSEVQLSLCEATLTLWVPLFHWCQKLRRIRHLSVQGLRFFISYCVSILGRSSAFLLPPAFVSLLFFLLSAVHSLCWLSE